VTAPAGYPAALGDIATSGKASAQFAVTFAGCHGATRFALGAPWSSATYNTGTLFTVIDVEGDGRR
jgi:hypothetical protein